jgi:hypothetical protein
MGSILLADNHLVLGWRLNSSRDPVYWLTDRPRPGLQADSDLLRVSPASLATHMAVIAQSGSGKSYFLGRLIEEILIHTRARCVILDPNADFRFFHALEPQSLWRNARYDRQARTGKLPHERSRTPFARDWRRISKRIRLGPHGALRDRDQNSPYSNLRILLRDLSADFLLDETEPSLRHEIYHCHDFVRQVAFLLELKFIATGESVDSLATAEALLPKLLPLTKQERFAELSNLAAVYSPRRRRGKDRLSPEEMIPALAGNLGGEVGDRIWRHTISTAGERAASGLLYTSPEAARIYFGLLRRQVERGVLLTDSGVRDVPSAQSRLTVIDLPSLPDRMTRRLVVNAVLEAEWDYARKAWSVALQGDPVDDKRVPTFIVVDEAHNLLPAQTFSTAEAALREQFRIIAAEGRKYGLFLILVSQRPDKLDNMVISECENRAVMKLGAPSLVPLTRELLDLSDIPERVLAKCLEFELGRSLLVGRWVPEGPQVMMSAARRTREGGRNLRTDYWATPAWSST